MQIEIRADNSVKISGYVNAVERESRPVMTPKGKVIEKVESGVFRRALEKGENIPMTVDHEASRMVAQTSDDTLILQEDAIGLRAEAEIKDEEVVTAAKAGKIKGWSFGMRQVKDSIEERKEQLPLRHIRDMILDHITLVIHKNPVYSATSVEVRANGEVDVEERAGVPLEIKTKAEGKKQDYSTWEERIQKLKNKN